MGLGGPGPPKMRWRVHCDSVRICLDGVSSVRGTAEDSAYSVKAGKRGRSKKYEE